MKKRTFRDYLILFLKGTAMGAADTVPGVSGGTIAFISGIYEELVSTIAGVKFSLLKTWRKEGFSAMWKELNGNFLLALLSGIALSIFTLMHLAHYLLENQPVLIWAFFYGLVLASIWFVAKQIKKWDYKTSLALLIGAVAAYWITSLTGMSGANEGNYVFLFLSGAIAVIAMILPGISGAYILVLLGAYEEITKAVSDLDLKKIVVVGVGIIVGLLSFSKILKWLFEKYETLTLAVLTGFIAGSLNKIWPWKNVLESKEIDGELYVLADRSVWPNHFEGDPKVLSAFLFFAIGFALIIGLEILAKRMAAK